MDSQWLMNADFNPADATQSLSLAAGLPNALATVLNRTVFPNEYTAISNLATSAAGVAPGTAPAVFDSATAHLATVTQSVVDAGANFDAAAATALNSMRDSSGNLSVTFGNTAMQTFVESFPDAQNEDGTLGITEVSARLVATDGTSWDNSSSHSTPATSTDALQPFIEAGKVSVKLVAIDGTSWDNLSSRSTSAISTDTLQPFIEAGKVSVRLVASDGTNWDNLSSPSTPATSTDALQPFIEAGNAVRGGALMTRFPGITTANETAPWDSSQPLCATTLYCLNRRPWRTRLILSPLPLPFAASSARFTSTKLLPLAASVFGIPGENK